MIVVQITGFSDSGKSTVCRRLVAEARSEGHVVGYIKHHDGPLERQGSDTQLASDAGAGHRWLAGSDGSCRLGAPDDLAGLLAAAKAAGCSLVLVEGFKSQEGAKCWLRRHPADDPPPGVTGVALAAGRDELLGLPAGELLRRMPMREV